MNKQRVAIAIATGLSVLLLISIAVGFVFWLGPKKTGEAQTVISDVRLDALKLEAIAATERGDNYLEATGRWNELIAAQPHDRGLVLNQAVTLLLWIKHIDDRRRVVASNDRSMNSRLNREQGDAYKLADNMLVKFSGFPPLQTSSEKSIAARQAWLESALFEVRSREFQGEEAVKLHKLAMDKLLDHLVKDATATFMIPQIVALLPHVQDKWPDFKPRVAEAAYQAWTAERQRVCLEVHATRSLIEAKDARLLEPLAASIEQASKFSSELTAFEPSTPQQLLEGTRKLIEAGDWSSLNEVKRWLDLLTKSSVYAEDAGRLQPELVSLLVR